MKLKFKYICFRIKKINKKNILLINHINLLANSLTTFIISEYL